MLILEMRAYSTSTSLLSGNLIIIIMIIIIIIIITTRIFIAQSHFESSLGSHDECRNFAR